jgi:hypothetical protein
MRLANYLLVCLLSLVGPVLTTAEPASASVQAPPVIDDPGDGDETGMTCCYHG